MVFSPGDVDSAAVTIENPDTSAVCPANSLNTLETPITRISWTPVKPINSDATGESNDPLIFKEAEVVSAKNENSNINSPTGSNKKEYVQNFENKPISIVSLKSVDINRADSFELQSLKGIGSVIAKRIIKYRDALGGFYDLLQLEEVYGMNSQTFMEINHLIKIDDSIINKIDINAVDDVTLERHPYITKKQASIIVKYRNNHGGFKCLEDFAKVKIFSTSELEKIRHYIKF